MSDLPVLTLNSCTVFWKKDLGMSTETLQSLRRDDKAGLRLATEINDWLQVNAKGVFDIYENGVWFNDARDAVLFKVFWNGRFS